MADVVDVCLQELADSRRHERSVSRERELEEVERASQDAREAEIALRNAKARLMRVATRVYINGRNS